MRTLEPKITNWETVEWRHTSKWRSPQTVRAHDMADFGPEASPDPWAAQTAGPGRKKPVLYVPIPRLRTEERFPRIGLTIRLEVLGHASSALSAFDGVPVEIEVLNVWDRRQTTSHNVKEAQLKYGAFTLTFTESDLKEWLDPAKWLKARLNESLLDFWFRIPSMVVRGSAFEGQSCNRLFLYRRRNILFYPGVFGSQVQLKDDDGKIRGFPHWDRDVPLYLENVPGEAVQLYRYMQRLVGQEIGVLECDSQGQPLVESDPPRLLTMSVPPRLELKNLVADVFRPLHHARQQQHPGLPDQFLLYRLIARPYDWRKDLTETAIGQLKELKAIQQGLLARGAQDYDDQFTAVGHSTGGLIIRRMMREHDAEGLIDHVFFVNVPFRGAVKPASVIPTGRDPMDGPSMIPFVTPESLTSIALTAPIVYHLTATELSPEVTFRKWPDGQPPQEFRGMDGVREFVKLCLRVGLMPNRKVVRSVGNLTPDERRRLALGSEDWAHFWRERFERERSHRLLEWTQGRKDTWSQEQVEARGLQEQDRMRKVVGWSTKLEKDADRFHRMCEQGTADSNNIWVDRAYLFYSAHEKVPTTLGVEAVCEFRKPYPTLVNLLEAMGVHPREVDKPRPLLRKMLPRGKRTRRAVTEPFENGVWRVENISQEPGGDYVWEQWRFTSLQQCVGDGTVPLWSQLGFGAPVKTFKKVVRDEIHPDQAKVHPLGPQHMDAPNSHWTWARIVEVLRAQDVSEHLASTKDVDTVAGEDIDTRVKADPRRPPSPSEPTALSMWAQMLKAFGVK